MRFLNHVSLVYKNKIILYLLILSFNILNLLIRPWIRIRIQKTPESGSGTETLTFVLQKTYPNPRPVCRGTLLPAGACDWSRGCCHAPPRTRQELSSGCAASPPGSQSPEPGTQHKPTHLKKNRPAYTFNNKNLVVKKLAFLLYEHVSVHLLKIKK